MPNRLAGGSGTLDCLASLAMTGRAKWVSSIYLVVGRRPTRRQNCLRRGDDRPATDIVEFAGLLSIALARAVRGK